MEANDHYELLNTIAQKLAESHGRDWLQVSEGDRFFWIEEARIMLQAVILVGYTITPPKKETPL